jgi:hypothetical protein
MGEDLFTHGTACTLNEVIFTVRCGIFPRVTT